MAKRNGGIIGPSNVPTGQYGGTASGVWRLRDAFNYIKAGLWPGSASYPVGNSLRFNRPSSDYLTRANTVNPTDRKIQTFSTWVKRSALVETNYRLISGYNGSSSYSTEINFNSNCLRMEVGGSSQFEIKTSALYRDTSAWYHIVVAWDTTQATASNRVKMYVNGSQITSFSTANYPNQNDTPQITVNGSNTVIASGWGGGSETFDGYMSETYFIDGQALTPSSFGKTDTTTGIWTPLPYTGTFGIAGFYLKFANSAALGTDSSGNGNTFTATNLTSIDQTTDTPTNNFCTMNPLDNFNGGTYSEGNLKFTNDAVDLATRSTMAVSQGKWYWEAKWTYAGSMFNQAIYFGILDTVAAMNSGGDFASNTSAFSVIYNPNGGGLTKNGVSVGSTYAGSVNSIFGFKLDLDNGDLYIHQNGTYYNSGNAVVTGITSGKTYSPFFAPNAGATDSIAEANFGNPIYSSGSNTDGAGYGNFSYAVPSGYYALNTKNLATYG
jgi:hypothetical protein